MRKIAMLSGIIIFLSFLTALPDQSYACDCIITEDPVVEKENHDGVFAGEVVEIVDKNKNKTVQSTADLLEIKILVKETWKGVEHTTITLRTERDTASCGFPFQVGEEYLVYANQMNDQWKVNNCSRTARLSEAEEDIAIFGPGEKPTKKAEKESAGDRPVIDHANTVVIALLGVIVIGVAIGFIRKKPK